MAENSGTTLAVSNYNNVYSKTDLIVVCSVMTALPIIVVALRFYTRHHFRIGFGWDDWAILFAVILCLGTGIADILAAAIGGMGSHQILGPNGELIHTTQLYNYEKCRYIINLLSTINLGIVKISILLFYKRLFVTKSFQWTSRFMLTLVTAWTIGFGVSMALQCIPTSLFWQLFEVEYSNYHCLEVRPLYLGLAYSDFILDVLVLILPIPFVWVLHMPWRKKIAVLDILLLGAIVLASGLARLITYIQTNNSVNADPIPYVHDTPWWTAGTLFWAFCANSVAIIGACLPTLGPLWNGTRSRMTTTARTYGKSSQKSKTANSDSSHYSQEMSLQSAVAADTEARAADQTPLKKSFFTPTGRTITGTASPSTTTPPGGMHEGSIHVATTVSVDRNVEAGHFDNNYTHAL